MQKKNMKNYMFKRGKNECGCDCKSYSGCGGAVYGLGFIGAAIYYVSIANSFWVGVLGILKAIVWPAFLVYEILKYLGM